MQIIIGTYHKQLNCFAQVMKFSATIIHKHRNNDR